MMRQTNKNGYRPGCRPGEQEPRPPVTNQAEVGKLNTGFKSKSRLKIIDCKAATLISSFNVRSLKSKEKMGELTALAEEKRIDILCIQENHIYHENVDIQMKDMGKGWVLAMSSGTKNTVNSTVGGVGILMSPFAYKSLEYLEKVSSRILLAKFSGNPAPTVITCYSPTNCSPDNKAVNFYSLLSDVI